MKIEWSELAITDLENIRDYISKDSTFYASIFIEKVLSSVEKLSSLPQLGRQVSESNDENIREIVYHNYRIMYRVDNLRILVLAVLHGSRDLEKLNKPWEII